MKQILNIQFHINMLTSYYIMIHKYTSWYQRFLLQYLNFCIVCTKFFMRARTSNDNIICSFKLANKSPRQLVRIDESLTQFIYEKQQQQKHHPEFIKLSPCHTTMWKPYISLFWWKIHENAPYLAQTKS